MLALFEAERRSAALRTLEILGAACVLSGLVALGLHEHTSASIRPPALASYVQLPMNPPSVMVPPAVPYVMIPAPLDTPGVQVPPGQPFLGRAGAATMMADGTDASSRREFVARAGAALAGFSAVQSASAKAGQFSKESLFGFDISSPYVPGGPQGLKGTLANPESTYGYKKSDGPILAAGYDTDVTREKAAFEVSAKIVQSQGPNIDSKTWWLVRDNMRGQAYNMKANMLALNKVLPAAKKPEAEKAYKKFWKEVESLDLACTKKEYDLAKKEYADVLAALDAYKATIA